MNREFGDEGGSGSDMDLDCASLHLGHGLRPMKKMRREPAFVRAQRRLPSHFFRMSHGWREKSVVYILDSYYNDLEKQSEDFL
ncbi:hypothetical protein AALB39_01740 [Lachnospiraceae bacterium 54-53]